MNSIVLWYDIGRQGATNESMSLSPILKDLSGNGHDAVCKNFAWGGMSGIGGYTDNIFTSGRYVFFHSEYLIAPDTISFSKTYVGSPLGIGYWETASMTPRLLLEVSGIKAGEHLYVTQFNRKNDHTADVELHNGYNDVQLTFSDQYSQYATLFSSYNPNDNPITVRILPLYPGAIVADGVDDFIYAEGLEPLTDFTVMAEREFIRFDQYGGLAFKWSQGAGSNGAFIFELSFNNDKAVQPDECWVFSNAGGGGDNDITPAEGRVSWMTPASYNGQPLTRGTRTDGRRLDIFSNKGDINRTCSAALWSFLLFRRTLSEAEIEWVKAHMMGQQEHNEEWYGVEFYTASSNPDCIRIGNPELHRTLPVHNQMKGVLLADDGTENKMLNESDWTGETLDGSQGQSMVRVPKQSYWRFETDGNIRRVKFSTKPLPGFKRTPQGYVAALEASVQRSTNKLSSVVNTDADYRGGNNNAEWDGTYRSLLGLPATSISGTNFRTYARNRKAGSAEWNGMVYDMQKLLYWLFVVEYGTLNTNKAFNAEKDSNGYAQGGLGNGVTNLNYSRWRAFNGSNPFIPCGYTNSLGNGTGQIDFTMPFEYDAGGEANYAGEYNAETAYTDGQFVSQGEELYECIADATAGTELTDTTYFKQITRTVTSVVRYRGVENPFGHIWKWTDGCKCLIQSEADGGLSEFYVCDDPAAFTSSGTLNYELRGNLSRKEGYVKKMILGEDGEIMPLEVGAGSTTYFCDYFYTNIPASGVSERGVLFGGYALYGASAGFVSARTNYAATYTNAHFGSRLCFIPE